MSLLDPFIEQLAADGITVDDSLVVATAPLTPITKLCCSPLYRRE
ncbi:MAG: hypothetical protein ACLRI7_10435 [Ruthenibacterium lactatiformans]